MSANFSTIILTTEINFKEDSLLTEESVSFSQDIDIEKYIEKNKYLISFEDNNYFSPLDFLQIKSNNLLFLKEQFQLEDEQGKKKILFFILLTVLKQHSNYDAFDILDKKYGLIFDPLFLPDDPTKKCTQQLIILINLFLTDEFHRDPNIILDNIINYIKSGKSIYNFLPLLVHLLQEKYLGLIEKVVQTDLFDQIIQSSKDHLPIFDYFRHFLYKFPSVTFLNSTAIMNIQFIFFDEVKNRSIIACLEKSIENLDGDETVFRSIIIIFSNLVRQACDDNKDRTRFIVRSKNFVVNLFKMLSLDFDISLFYSSFSKFAIHKNNEGSFEFFIELLISMVSEVPWFIHSVKNPQIDFFSILKNCEKKISQKCFIDLINLSTCGEKTKFPVNKRYIQLYQSINLLLELMPKNKMNEVEIVNHLIELSQNPGNNIELDRSKLPDFILQRLPAIQDQEELREKYIKLFAEITSKTYNKTVFNHTIKLMKNLDFKYSDSILKILNENLKNFVGKKSSYRYEELDSRNKPFSFFRFDNNNGCGIICPKSRILLNVTFCFWLRINEIDSEMKTPLIFFDHEKYKLDIYFQNHKLYMQYYQVSPSKEIKVLLQPTEINYEFETGKWYFFCFSIWKSPLLIFSPELTLDVYNENNEKSNFSVKFSFNIGEYQIYVCRKPIDNCNLIEYPSLICDLSSFLLLNDYVESSVIREKLIKYLFSNEMNISNFENLLCFFNPSESQDNLCINVNKKDSRIPYSGRTIPIITNFGDVFQTCGAINTLLPLINLLETDNSIYSLHLILNIFVTAIEICEDSFVKFRFFELLSSFLLQINNLINSEVINDLYEILKKINLSELLRSMIRSIYLNSNFIAKLDNSLFSIFSKSSPLALYHDYLLKIVFEDLSLLVYRALNYESESEKSAYYWELLRYLCIDSPNNTNIEILVDLLCSNKNEFVTINILKILHEIYSSKDEINQPFNFTTFIITFSRNCNSVEIIELILKIIQKVSEEISIDDNFYSMINYLVIVFKPSLEDVRTLFFQLIASIFDMITKQGSFYFLPLFATLLKYSENQEFNKDMCNSFIQSKNNFMKELCEMPLWTYWITNLFIQAFNPNTNPTEFASLCVSVTESIKEIIELLNFFDFYNGATLKGSVYKNESESKINFVPVKEQILMILIQNSTFMNSYSSYVYEFILFSIHPFKKENKNPHLSYFGDFVTELFGGLDVKVSLRKTINKHMIELIKKSSQTFLMIPISSFKVGICQGKIEVSNKEANSYISKLYEKNENAIEEEEEDTDEKHLETNEDEKYYTISHDILRKCLPEYEDIVMQNLQLINKDIISSLRFKREYPDNNDNTSIEERLLFVCDMEKYDKYFTNYNKFISDQEENMKNQDKFLLKLKDSFMKSVYKIPGPWINPNETEEIKHFKVLNRVSKTGQKILMKINDNFNIHSDASRNRLKTGTINISDLLIFKPVETIPLIPRVSDNFKTNIVFMSPSKQEKGTLIVSKEIINLITENNNIFIYWNEIDFILNRRDSNIENSCEIFKKNGRSYFIVFAECKRESFYSFIDKLKLSIEYTKEDNKFNFFNSLRKVCNRIYQNKKSSVLIKEINLTNLWKTRKISTFSYLYYLNILSGRSYNNLTVYPIYPFPLSNKTSEILDLNDESFYRDFSSPLFVLSPQRLKSGVETYKDISSFMEPYLSGELPLSALYVVWYLLRVEPFTTIHVSQFQNLGKYPRFDVPDRLFQSFDIILNLIYTGFEKPKEIIPEFFNFPYFLVNENNFDLGKNFNNVQINEVLIPEWSRNPFVLISTFRQMLEGKIADKYIGKWIDVMFGTKRRIFEYEGGKYEIYKSYNYPETPDELYTNEVNQFGSMPEQLFYENHPERDAKTKQELFNLLYQNSYSGPNYFIKNILITSGANKAIEINTDTKELIEIPLPNVCGEVLCYSSFLNLFIIGTKKDPFLTAYNIKTMQTKTVFHLPSIITSVYLNRGRYLIMGDNDCSIHVFDLLHMKLISSSNFHSDCVVSVACCYDNGLIASIDQSSTLVFETLVDHLFINSVSLTDVYNKLNSFNDICKNEIEYSNLVSSLVNKSDFIKDIEQYNKDRLIAEAKNSSVNHHNDRVFTPKICVFKSGVVAVGEKSMVTLFDFQGKVLTAKHFDNDLIEIHRCTSDTHEFLIMGVGTNKIFVFDVSLLTLIVIYESYFESISTCMKSASLITYYRGKIQSFDFSELIPSQIQAKNRDPVVITGWKQ